MGSDGWNSFTDQPITEAKGPRILVWHVFQGVLVSTVNAAQSNGFNVRWRDLPEEWTKTSDRLPDREDADFFNCVIARHWSGSISIKGYHSVTERETDAWAKVPDPPRDYKELILNG